METAEILVTFLVHSKKHCYLNFNMFSLENVEKIQLACVLFPIFRQSDYVMFGIVAR